MVRRVVAQGVSLRATTREKKTAEGVREVDARSN